MDMQTGKLSLKNPDSDTEWGMPKSAPKEKVANYCAKKNERNGPREITKPTERQKEEDGRETTIAVSESEDIIHLRAADEGDSPHRDAEHRLANKWARQQWAAHQVALRRHFLS